MVGVHRITPVSSLLSYCFKEIEMEVKWAVPCSCLLEGICLYLQHVLNEKSPGLVIEKCV